MTEGSRTQASILALPHVRCVASGLSFLLYKTGRLTSPTSQRWSGCVLTLVVHFVSSAACLRHKGLSYPYLRLQLKTATAKEATELSSHFRGHTEVMAGPTLGNGIFQDSTKTDHRHTLSLSLRVANHFLPSFLPILAGPRKRTGRSLPGSLSHLQGHSPAAPQPSCMWAQPPTLAFVP